MEHVVAGSGEAKRSREMQRQWEVIIVGLGVPDWKLSNHSLSLVVYTSQHQTSSTQIKHQQPEEQGLALGVSMNNDHPGIPAKQPSAVSPLTPVFTWEDQELDRSGSNVVR
eukprot:5660390-Amphidinium_carterae.1